MTPNYEIISYRPDLERQVIELQTHSWSPDLALNASYFEWKYEQNPYVKEPLIYLAMCEGKVVGMRGFFGACWECGIPAQRFTSLYADDMVIAPDHRGRGLMAKIMTQAFADLAYKGYDYAFNLSAVSVTLNSSLRMGWRSAGWVGPMRLRSWRTAVRNGIVRHLKTLPGFADKLSAFVARQSLGSRTSLEKTDTSRLNRILKQTPSISIEDKPRVGAMAELVERIGSDGRIRHVRDGKYFQWRFQNPLSRYRYIYWGTERLEGYLVLQEYTRDATHSVLNIVDWEASDTAIEKALLNIASVLAKGRELYVWTATVPKPTIALLQQRGFKFCPRPSGATHFPTEIIVRQISRSGSEGEWIIGGRGLLDLASWDVKMLYSMHG